MADGQTSSKKRLAMVLALVATIGLVVCSTMFYVSQSTKKATTASELESTPAVAPAATIESKTDATADVSATEGSDIFIDHATVQEPVVKRVVRRGSPRSSRKQIATRFPAPPVAAARNPLAGPNGEVEMWAGDKRSFISVPPGSKFED